MVIAMLGIVACLALSACGNSSEGSGTTQYDENGVAAVVNGVEIPESDVNAYIDSFRSTDPDLSSDEGWNDYLAQQGYTQDSYRQYVVIESLIKDELVRQAAEAQGITVDENYIADEIAQQKAAYPDEASWQQALAAIGCTENQYRSLLEYSYLVGKLEVIQGLMATPTTEQIQQYCDEHAADYASKRSSEIVFAADDKDTAQAVLDGLRSSTDLQTDFAAAVQTYSIDQGSKTKGGDIGWYTFITGDMGDYETVLDGLQVGQVGGLAQSGYGYHVIMCTDDFEVPAGTSTVDVSTIPTEIYDKMVADLTQEQTDEALANYLDGLRSSADVTIYGTEDPSKDANS